MNDKILQNDERAVYALRSLYAKYGYLPYKMSKFEEYDLYVKNKDFLLGDGVITFNDNGGKLLALKPDVTLSILKNGAKDKQNQKVYYNETVYRKSADGNFKEIMQVGLENIGVLTPYDIFETVYLAVKSLDEIGGKSVLELSHLGLIGAITENADEQFRKQVLLAISSKSEHTVAKLCDEYGYINIKKPLCALVSLCGDNDKVLSSLDGLYSSQNYDKAVNDLKNVYALIVRAGYGDKVSIDFSLTGNMKYYNGIVFNGFIEGVSEKVLSGGQYDLLAKKIRSANSGAIGFAVYTDLLISKSGNETDFDIAVIYDEKTSQTELFDTMNSLTASGKTACALTSEQIKGRFSETVDLRGGVK